MNMREDVEKICNETVKSLVFLSNTNHGHEKVSI